MRLVGFALAAGCALPLASQTSLRLAPPGLIVLGGQRGRGGGGNGERGSLGGGLGELRQLTPKQQEQALENDPRFQALPPEQKKEMLSRLQWFNSLPRDQQNRILTRLAHLGELTPEQRTGLEEIYRRWQTMTPAERQAFQRAYNNLNKMTPEERAKRMNSAQFQQRYSPDEQQMLHRALDLHLPPDVVGSSPGGDGPSGQLWPGTEPGNGNDSGIGDPDVPPSLDSSSPASNRGGSGNFPQ